MLTFMYDEDRQTALAMYERMFDETADEQGLMQLLVSPTRQAVVLARSYDAKERKLQIESRSMDENYTPDPEDVPSFVFIIDKTAQQAAELSAKALPVDEDQMSIFEEVPAEEAAEAVAEEVEAEEAETEESEDVSDVEETAKALDAFLADFSVENGELVATKAEESKEPAVEELAEEIAEEAPAAEESEASEEAAAEEAVEEAPVKYRTKTNIFLLILYIFLALPATVAGVALLLIPTVLFLALAACFASVGVSLIGTCLGSFAVIADMLVVFGAGLILVALGLLFVWLFIWFLGGAIFGFIRGICRLGRKTCCKEVAVQ